MYRKVNDLFGDVIKVTPSSKIVGDMAMFLVQNNLEPEDVFRKGDDLTFPQGVVDFFKGMIGQPVGGFPKRLQEIILKGEQPLTCRPGELLEPVDFAARKVELEGKLGHSVSERDVLSAVLYPAFSRNSTVTARSTATPRSCPRRCSSTGWMSATR